MRTHALDMFSNIASKLNNDEWETLVDKIKASNFQMAIKALADGLVYTGYKMTKEDKLNVAETFRVKSGFEFDIDKLDGIQVTMQAFVNARKQTQLKRLNELISLEEEDE